MPAPGYIDMKTDSAAVQVHPFPPVFDERSETLILGSFPSVASRAEAFYYAHPRNRFWPVLAALYGAPLPVTVAQKTALLLEHRLALWDVIASCEIAGSSDSSICRVVPSDLSVILCHAPIRRVFVNGGTAARWYRRCQLPRTGLEAVCLPSTSPANAAWSQERLLAAWRVLLGENRVPAGDF